MAIDAEAAQQLQFVIYRLACHLKSRISRLQQADSSALADWPQGQAADVRSLKHSLRTSTDIPIT